MTTTLTILVADDDVDILSLVVRHLHQRPNTTIIEASDGEEALKLVKKHHPSLVLLDVMMPGMTGWEVCRAVREEAALKHTRIIMLTGIGEKLNELTSPLYGADAYLDKPFEIEELDAEIERVLALKK